MNKSKKILAFFVTLAVGIIFFQTRVDALSGTISISANRSQVVVGNTVTFTVNVNYSSGLIALQYNASYDSSKLSLVSGSTSGAPVFNSSTKSQTYTYTFRAKQSGTASFSFSASGAAYTSDSEVNFSTQSRKITIITQEQLEASYSKNNNLASLGVEGATLSPNFSSSVTQYTVNLPANTETINVTGNRADYTASVSGLGKHTVEDGSNTIKVTVTAQNGATKTYTINAIVEELDPINVTVENVKYTVVRKQKLLESPSSDFKDDLTKINDEEVPALINEKAKMVLVGLKDDDGEIALFIYDEQNNSYKRYNQYTFKSLTLYIEDKVYDKADGQKEISINEKEIMTYTINDDEYFYFYAINLENGNENLYRYDEDENTIQRCIMNNQGELPVTEDEEKAEKLKVYQYIIIGLLGFIFSTYIIILINAICKNRKKHDNDDVMEMEKENQDKESDEEKETTEEINKITEEERDKLIKEQEDEIKRINTSLSDTANLVNSINELFTDEIEQKKKKKQEKKKDNKEKKKREKNKKDKTIEENK